MIPIEKLRFCWSSRILAFVFPIVLLLIAGGYFGLKSFNHGNGDPRISYSGPFENIHPSVSYVGDNACASCHQDYLDRFRHHPMGMALSTTTEATPIEGFGLASRNPFKVESLQYKVAIEKNNVYHEEGSATGKSTARFEISHAVGSGSKARSYLINREGFLFQSPITWYPLDKIWDLSPGYETRNMHFNRAVSPACLFCHANFADHVEGTVNRYHAPVFHGMPIGCERCHGPGELHVKKQEGFSGGAMPDNTIVNPSRLDPDLKEAICQQCHVQGEQRVLAKGRKPFDFRPGMPLQQFWVDFIDKKDRNGDRKFVTSVEQMRASRCFESTKGQARQLGCTSCHDPHSVPNKESKAAFFQNRCLQCHQDIPCTEPRETRITRQPDDSCIACHMPQRGTEINHSTITDHRIPKRPTGSPEEKSPQKTTPLPEDLVPFHPVPPGFDHADRDLGLAMMGMLDRGLPDSAAKYYAQKALPLLEKAILQDSKDHPAMETLGDALVILKYFGTAREYYQRALLLSPDSETSWHALGILELETSQYQEAIKAYEKAMTINPYNPDYHLGLARVFFRMGKMRECVKAASQGIDVDPNNVKIASLLIQAQLAQGSKSEAMRIFEKLADLTPKTRQMELKLWWDLEFRKWEK